MNQPHREDWGDRFNKEFTRPAYEMGMPNHLVLDDVFTTHGDGSYKSRDLVRDIKIFIEKEIEAVRAETVKDILALGFMNYQGKLHSLADNFIGDEIRHWAKSKGITLTPHQHE